MARPDKAAAVAELTEAFRESSAAVLTEYRGLTVAELKELRRSLAGNATYNVVKNTLTKIAAREAGVAAFEDLLQGPSAIAFISGDPVEVAKSLRTFGKDHPHLVVKGGILDGKSLSADEIRKLADLESREVLLAKLAGGFAAPATQLVNVLAAPMRQLAQVLGALQAKAEADPDWVRGEAPAAEAAADEAPAAEAAADEAPAAEAATDEAPAEEAAAEAAPAAKAAADETPAADATTDAPADEAPAEQPAADEAPAAPAEDAAPSPAAPDAETDTDTAADPAASAETTEPTTDDVAETSDEN
ncbi:MAG: 50S ribosomal protein L10 [Frankiaceae bacterium]|nr:50S ribosomal protein L10 [Frankiaceae bacterium]